MCLTSVVTRHLHIHVYRTRDLSLCRSCVAGVRLPRVVPAIDRALRERVGHEIMCLRSCTRVCGCARASARTRSRSFKCRCFDRCLAYAAAMLAM